MVPFWHIGAHTIQIGGFGTFAAASVLNGFPENPNWGNALACVQSIAFI